MKVKEIMTKDLTSVREDESLKALIYLMEKTSVSGVPVTDERGVVVGFISERDVISAALPNYFEMLRTASYIPDINQLSRRLEEIKGDSVSEYMVEDVITVDEDEEDIHVADLIIRNELNRVPVIDKEGMLCGVVQRIDLLGALL
ncbi:MAG: HPP family protein [Candidatus Bipolaricaulota bacterium]